MASDEPSSHLAESGVTIRSDSEHYSAGEENTTSPASSGSPAVILYQPPTVWSLVRSAAINLLLPFINGMMMGYGELFAHEIAFRLGWSGTKSLSKSSTSTRQFGTAIRNTNGGSKTLRASQAIGLLGGRRAVGVGAATAGLMAQNYLRAPAQARSLSLWPWSSGLSGGDKFPETADAATSSAASSTPAAPVEAAPIPEATAVSPSTPDLSGAADPASSIDLSGATASVGDVLDGSHYLNLASDHIGYLRELGLNFGWGPSSMAQWGIEHLHVWGGMPWWAAILGYAVATRLILLKPGIDAFVQQRKLQALKKDPRGKAAFDKMSAMMSSGGTASTTELLAARAEVQRLQRSAGISTWKMALPMIQMPIGIGVFRLTSGCADLPVPSFETGGFMWLMDLTAPDPFYILPLASSAMMYVMLKHSMKMSADKSQTAMFKAVQYVLTPISFLVSLKLNAALQLYFIATAGLQAMQTLILSRPAIGRALGVDQLNLPEKVVNADKIAWEAPREIQTTATVQTPALDELDVNTSNPITNMKNTVSSVRGKLNSFAERGNAKKTSKDAAAYEERRALEEKERYYARREEAARRARERSRR
ncbi:hypothetical protein PspLS_02474 [Pyricularia sp. CBS 133598]|nr:hypothetical protein PspLS_02474 [Pyricularia sp. CBS 133598]